MSGVLFVWLAGVREECGRREQRVAELEATLRAQQTTGAGLCVSCAHNPAVYTQTQLTRSVTYLSSATADYSSTCLLPINPESLIGTTRGIQVCQ